MIAVMLVVDLLIMTYFGLRSDAGLARFSVADFSREISRTVNENGETCYSMSQQGTDRIDDFHGFAFLLELSVFIFWAVQGNACIALNRCICSSSLCLH